MTQTPPAYWDSSGPGRRIDASSGGEGLGHLRSHKLKPIHKTVCFVNTRVEHKAFRHQLNLDITVFIVMNNKSFSTALQQARHNSTEIQFLKDDELWYTEGFYAAMTIKKPMIFILVK